MSRPALAATRSIEIFELLATFPERQFTLSEIVNATGINIASSHAILNVLTEKGYLIRSPKLRTYQLGPSIVAIGLSAQKSQPIVARAMQAAEDLHGELGIPVLLSTLVGTEVLAVMSLKDRAGHDAGMEVGERLPLVAPIGAPFLAWASDTEVEEWIERRNTPLKQGLREALLDDLKLTRDRGYQVALRPAEHKTIGSLMAEMATSSHIVDYKIEVSKLIHEFSVDMCQPVKFEEEAFYDVMLIASPIFDQEGNAAFNLSLGGFPQHLSGAQLIKYAERLSHTCLEIMRSDRSQLRRQAQA